jgi:soluble lytic murein transglycosylase-like protein
MKSKLLIGLSTAGLFMAGFGGAVLPAAAQPHSYVLTLANGTSVPYTGEPGTAPAEITVGGQSVPVVKVQDNGAAAQQPAETTPAPAQTTPSKPKPQAQSQPPATTPTQTQPQTQPQAQTRPKSTAPVFSTKSTRKTQPQKPAPASPAAPAPQPTTDSRPRPKVTTTGPKKARPKNQGSRTRTRPQAPARTGGAPTPAARKAKKAKQAKKVKRAQRQQSHRPVAPAPAPAVRPVAPPRTSAGTPTAANPTFSLAQPAPAPVGVPNFFIDKFRIPPFLLPIYQAAGIEYGVRWEVLAAINEIETDYGRNLNVSSAGAVGWMQFMPATWAQYGVDANHDGRKDPYNPVDAIFAAARYLKAAGADRDIARAIFAYNHASWYVDSVLMRARLIGGLPSDLVGSLTGLTQGHFPVHAEARYADDIREPRRVAPGGNAALPVDSRARTGVNIYARAGAPVIAVQDGKIVRIGVSAALGRFVQLRDVYGNTYTYAHLAGLARTHPVPKPQPVGSARVSRELERPKTDPRPTKAATAGRQAPVRRPTKAPARRSAPVAAAPAAAKERVFANPYRPQAFRHGGEDQLFHSGAQIPGFSTFRSFFTQIYGLKRDDVNLRPLRRGSTVVAGTILGRIGRPQAGQAPHVLFQIRPAGKDAPLIDPKPILDGWKLLESTAIYRAAGKNPFFGTHADKPTIGQLLLLSKEALAQRVLSDPNVQIYACGRRDIQAGSIDRRVLATMEFLAASGLKPTISSLHCGHSYLTTSGNVSEHSTGTAMDIAAINGIPILGHQGPGSITDITIRRLLTLQGTMKPHQIISLMTFDGADNTMALADHDDHIHVGWRPLFAANPRLGQQLEAALQPQQWLDLIGRLGNIHNPTVLTTPSKYALSVKPRRASAAHPGE